jgi:ankyrin repeat protein
MLTPEIYAERNTAERQAYLLAQAAYEDAMRTFKEGTDACVLEREKILEPLLQKKRLSVQHWEFMGIQINYLEAIAGPDLLGTPAFSHPVDKACFMSENSLSKLYNAYQRALNVAIEHIVTDHENLMRSRHFFLKNGALLKISNQIITDELQLFHTEIEVAITYYRTWPFPTTPEDALEQLKTIRELKMKETAHYARLLEDQTQILSAHYRSEDQRKKIFLELNAINLAIIDAQNIYDLCQDGQLESLKKFLMQKNPRQYLSEKAPESLHKSCAKNQLLIVEYLLDLGLTQEKDRYGYYPIHYVCLHEDLTKTALLLDMLIQNTASIANSISPHYETPLHTAAIFDNRTAIRYFMACGADINDMAIRRSKPQKKTQSYTPLHCAVIAGNVSMVAYLMAFGACAFSMHQEGLSALDEALLRHHTEIVSHLHQKGYALSTVDYYRLLAWMDKHGYPKSRQEPVIALARTLLDPGTTIGLQNLEINNPPPKTKTLSTLFPWRLFSTVGNKNPPKPTVHSGLRLK